MVRWDFRLTQKFTLILTCIAGLFALGSFNSSKTHSNLNVNGWSICIGKKEILHSSKNARGDTAYINRNKINSKDSLFIHEFICGGTIKPPQVSLSIAMDNEPFTNIELVYIRGINFYPLSCLGLKSDFKKLIVQISSSYDYYYPEFDKNKPMATLIIT